MTEDQSLECSEVDIFSPPFTMNGQDWGPFKLEFVVGKKGCESINLHGSTVPILEAEIAGKTVLYIGMPMIVTLKKQ